MTVEGCNENNATEVNNTMYIRPPRTSLLYSKNSGVYIIVTNSDALDIGIKLSGSTEQC